MIFGKDRSRSVAVVYVCVNDHRFVNRAIGLQAADRHRNIVDRAESFAMPRVGVMEASAKITSEPIAHGSLRRQNGSARSQPEGLNQLARIRNFQFHDIAE
jgi:hypothetical protein